jgi:hypothetical protein
MNDLFLLLERQVQFVRKQESYRLFMALPALVDFVQREPRLRCIADSVAREFEEAVAIYRDADKRCSAEVLDLFERNAAWTGPIYAQIAGKNVDDSLNLPRERLSVYAKRSGVHDGDPLKFRKHDTSQADAAISQLQCFIEQLERDGSLGESQSQHGEMTRRLAGISWDHQRAHFKFVHTMCASAGASWKILVDLADAVCPAMPATTKEDAWLDAYLKAEKFKKRMSKADLLLGIDRSEDPECEDWRAKADSALEIFLQDMALRIGIHLSHRALIMRFKTKCELFLADGLRTRMTAKSTKAELYATQTAAQFLFDEGLNPLFNAQIVRLRPDLFDPRLPHALYVEAKQYGTANPKRMIEKATWQVWDTWNELDSGHKVREAFLLVFRRAGPLVTFDESVHLEGRTLHPVLVDVAPAAKKGSRATQKPIHISASELLPQRGRPA